MKPHTKIHIRIGLSLISVTALLAVVSSDYQPPAFASSSGNDPMATIKSYNFGWKDKEHFYFRVQFGSLADLQTYTKSPWYFKVYYADDKTGKSATWKDSVVTNLNTTAFWATIRVTANAPNYGVKPSPQTPGGPFRGTGKASVVVTNDDRRHVEYSVNPPLNDLEEDQNP